MRYFARSLSNADKLKYIITDREDREWNVYGFCPIIYTLKDYVLHEKLIVELSKLLLTAIFSTSVNSISFNPNLSFVGYDAEKLYNMKKNYLK